MIVLCLVSISVGGGNAGVRLVLYSVQDNGFQSSLISSCHAMMCNCYEIT